MLAFTLKYKDSIFYQQLESAQKITFGSGKKDTIQMREMSEAQISISAFGEQIALQTRPPFAARQ